MPAIRSLFLILMTVAWANPAFADDVGRELTSGDLYGPSFQALFILFILAVLLESGLAVVFQWKPFLQTFDSRAVRPLFSFIAAVVFVVGFKLDIVTDLVNLYTKSANPHSLPGQILTALVISGGSAGVNRLFQALGFRPLAEQEQPETPKPPPTEAWIAVTPSRKAAVGPVNVELSADGKPAAIVGSVKGRSVQGFYRFLLRDNGRFPSSGGLRVQPGSYAVQLTGRDKKGDVITSLTWGPSQIAAGAIIDIALEI